MNALKFFSRARERLSAYRTAFNYAVLATEASRVATLTHAAHRATQRLGRWRLGVAIALFSAMNQAAAQTIGREDDGVVNTTANFSALTNLLQQFVTFMTGPFGKAVVVISIIAAFVTWVFAPREGIFGPILRVVVAGVAVLNAAAWMVQLGSGTTVNL